eukprot:Gb_35291 [translate_table: standard]
MDTTIQHQLAGWEIHGFHTMQDLDTNKIEEEAHSRWLRPNEIYAVLCNYNQFYISAKPLITPPSGTLILFDRKALRNFRKDGHLWQKKKDGKTVKEAHEHLKVGNEERIHVYYAHGEDNPKFVRRSYWLLDRAYEHIVLVHYREVSEVNTRCSISPQTGPKGASHLSKRIYTTLISPLTPANSSSSSGCSEKPVSWISSEELDSGEDASYYTGLKQVSGSSSTTGDGAPQLWKWNKTQKNEPGTVEVQRPEDLTIHEINTLDWEELLEPQESLERINNANRTHSHQTTYPSGQFNTEDSQLEAAQHKKQQSFVGNVSNQKTATGSVYWGEHLSNGTQAGSTSSVELGHLNFKEQNPMCYVELNKVIHNHLAEEQSVQPPSLETMDNVVYAEQAAMQPSKVCEPIDTTKEHSFKKQDSFGRWLNSVFEDSPSSADEWQNADYNVAEEQLDSCTTVDQTPIQGQVFCITEVSPMCAFSSEETKVIITGYFVEAHKNLMEAKWACVFGEVIVPAEVVQIGVFRCWAPPHASGSVNMYLTCGSQVPHSQILSFEYRHSTGIPLDNDDSLSQMDEVGYEDFVFQIRLAHLLFSSSKGIVVVTSKKAQRDIEKRVSQLFTNNKLDWLLLPKLLTERKKSFREVKSNLLQLILKNKLQEWILENMFDKRGATIRDRHGQGVIHLLAALGYEWAIHPFSTVGVAIDFRDASGWTALHWAAFFGRERTVAALLAVGAKANVVTDPTPEFPGGRTPADLASEKGYEGIAGYLAEKALTTHFEDLTIYDKHDARKQSNVTEFEELEGLTEDQLCMRDSLAAVRTAAEAAAKIQAAFREHSFKLRVKAFELDDHAATKEEAFKMIAALKIQKAYRNHREKRQFAAAMRIQHKFRGWKIRREFLNLRQQVIKIQACFRGHQSRKQYRKILWSVGILEKAILRWRQKRKGLRGHKVVLEISSETRHGREIEHEEDFFRIGRKYAEERVERSVVRVQAMYRSYRARADYRRMKQFHKQVQLEYEHVHDLDPNTDSANDISVE